MFDKPGNALLSPGDFVRHADQPDWGLGQIQSIAGHRITVNFENAGKVVIDTNNYYPQRDGHIAEAFSSRVEPTDTRVVTAIARAL